MPDDKKYTEKTEQKTEVKGDRWATPEKDKKVEYKKETKVKSDGTVKTEEKEEEEVE
jgi:hypothetical protein